MTDIYRNGLLYELRAARFLKTHGYRLLARRYRAQGGEIDLIALDGDVLVFIEVKARPRMMLGAGIGAVDTDKRRRLKKAAECYIAKSGKPDRFCRFDILEFTRAGIRHMKNAF
ncbi:MAG: YraN family protein [Clostridia bacterium]|nr:YraN family protein [Clostridia bacterium]